MASRLIKFPFKIIVCTYDQGLQQIGSGRSPIWLSLAWQLGYRGSLRRLTTSSRAPCCLPAQDRPHSAQILAMPQPFACNSMSEDKMASDRCFDMPIDHRLKPLLSSQPQKRSQIAYGSLQSILGRTSCQLKNGLECMVAVLPWFLIGSSEGCRPYLFTSDFARGGGNEGTGGTRLGVTNTLTEGVVVGRQRSLGGGTILGLRQ